MPFFLRERSSVWRKLLFSWKISKKNFPLFYNNYWWYYSDILGINSVYWLCSKCLNCWLLTLTTRRKTTIKPSSNGRLQLLQKQEILFLNKVASWDLKRLWHMYFPVNFGKVLREAFIENTSRRLLLLYWQFWIVGIVGMRIFCGTGVWILL